MRVLNYLFDIGDMSYRYQIKPPVYFIYLVFGISHLFSIFFKIISSFV